MILFSYPKERKLYILPSKLGVLFFLLLSLSFLVSLLYNNNMSYVLFFLFLSFFILSLFLTHENLRSVRLEFVGSEPTFLPDESLLRFRLQGGGGKSKYGIEVCLRDSKTMISDFNSSPTFWIKAPDKIRGEYAIGWVKLQTSFPFGFFRSWTYFHFPQSYVIYPQRLKGEEIFRVSGAFLGLQQNELSGEDFSEFKPYESADSLRHIHWKKLASADQLIVKKFQEKGESSLKLVWEDFSFYENPEERLSVLTYWAFHLYENGQSFSVEIPRHPELQVTSSQSYHDTLRSLSLMRFP